MKKKEVADPVETSQMKVSEKNDNSHKEESESKNSEKKSEKKEHFQKKKEGRKYKKWVIAGIIILIIILAIFGTKIGLWVNFMLGNDLVISLHTDKETLTLDNGQQENVNFEVKVQTNPFCKARCTSELKDISHSRVVDTLIFTLRPGNPFNQDYSFKPQDSGRGKELYQFSISCQGQKSSLCHTSEENITRTIIITLDHDLSEEEKELRSSTQEHLTTLAQKQAKQQVFFDYLNKITKESDALIIHTFEIPSTPIKERIDRNDLLIDQSEQWWNQELYSSLSSPLDEIEKNQATIELYFDRWNESLSSELNEYNALVVKVGEIQSKLMGINNLTLLSSSSLDLNQTIFTFNHKLELINQKSSLAEKQQWTVELESYVNSVNSTIMRERSKQAALKAMQLDTDKEVFCQISGVCSSGTEMRQYLSSLPSLESSCEAQRIFIKAMQDKADLLSGSGAYSNADSREFANTITGLIDYLQYLKAQELMQELNSTPRRGINDTNYNYLVDALNALMKPVPLPIEMQPSYNLSLIQELIRKQSLCSFITPNLEIASFSPREIKEEMIIAETVSLDFKEAKWHCPVYGEEKECCSTENCFNDVNTYPLIFVHGHAFNKDISTEYSLDAFNQIQNRLTTEGYIDAGAISGYAFGTEHQGLWRIMPAPFTFRGSYYYDFFEQESQYSLVQTKSENIDTYAIRLKDMITWVKYKTGRPKVIIVAHSMGGLVSRRYMQVFGSTDVQRLIMIGTPNQGIVGDVADYCAVVGEELECRDMQENSLFLNKLNREDLPKIPITNIVGVGCDMEGEDGDGVIRKDKAELPGVKNYYINGNCTSTDFLHNDLLKVNSYPEVYEMVKNALES